MTPVEFQFNYPDGKPIAGMEFVVKLPKSGFIHAVDGIIMPADLKFVTDAMGYALVELAPSSSVYSVRMTTPDQAEDYDSCRKGVTYKFYVPDSAEPVRAQDLFLAPPPNSEPWDETAIRELTEAKVIAVQSAETAVAASVSAEAAAVRAEAASAGIDEDAERAVLAASEAKASATSAANSATSATASSVSAGGSKDAAALSAAAALASQGAASASATTSTTKANEAAASAAAALVSQGAAKTSETNAKASEVAAAPAIAAGLRFCGSVAIAPTTRTNGTALQRADEYQNTVDNLRYSWTGTAWVALNSSAQQLEVKLTDPSNPANGAASIGRSSVVIAGVADLAAVPRKTDISVVIKDYHLGINNGGGGRVFFDPLMPKSSHNGGTVFSPTVPWNGNRNTLPAYLARTGETDPDGLGCWVRRERPYYLITMFGAIGDWNTSTNTGYDNRAVIEMAVRSVYHTVVPKGHFGAGGAGSVFGSGLIGKRVTGSGELHKMGAKGIFSFNTCIDVQIGGITMDGQIVRDEAENGNIWDGNRAGENFAFAVSFVDCHDCAVIGTTVYDFAWDGLRATGTVAAGGETATLCTSIDFVGNKLRNIRGSQLWMKAVAGGKINDNHQRNDETFAQKANAIFVVEWCSDIEVAGNRQFYIGDNGIGIGEPDNNAVVARNKRINVHDNLIDMTRYHAILIAQAEDSQVHSNIVKRGGAKTAMIGYSGVVNCGAITLLGGGNAPANVNVKVHDNTIIDPYEIGVYAYDRPGTLAANASIGLSIYRNTVKGYGLPPIPAGSTRMLSGGIITQLQHAPLVHGNTTTDGVGDGLRVFGDADIAGHKSLRIVGTGIHVPSDTLLMNTRLSRPLVDCETADTTGPGIRIANKSYARLIGCTALRAGRGVAAPGTENTVNALQFAGIAISSVRTLSLVGNAARECGASGLLTQFCYFIKDEDGNYSQNGQVLAANNFKSGAYIEGDATTAVKATFINPVIDGGTTQYYPIRALFGHADGVALDPEFVNNQVPSLGISTKQLSTIGVPERGSNSKGEYTKFADGTLITWGKQLVNVAVPAGQGVTWDAGTANQPHAFVGTPVTDVRFAMMTGASGAGNALYTLNQNYYLANDLAQVGVNMGTQPSLSHPLMTYGTLAAASYYVFFKCTGRWK